MLTEEGVPERGRTLVADDDLNAIARKALAPWIDIYPTDLRGRTEVVAPHVKTTTTGNTDFDKNERLATKVGQMPIVSQSLKDYRAMSRTPPCHNVSTV